MKLRTENIQKSYKGRKVVKGVSVEVNQGEIVGLLGPNGAGKTTSFYMIVGLVKPDEGTVYLDNTNITRTAMYKRAKKGIGYLPQEVSVFRKLSVEDNILSVLEMTKLSKKERKAKLEELLDEFSLHHVRKNLGKQLSGGEKRRTEIARALATDPKFILLDEPFAGVDPIAVEDIQSIVHKLKSKNIGILITDHNVQETLSITDRAYLLFEGNILKSGTAEELAADPIVRKVYLGKHFELKRKSFDGSDDADEQNELHQAYQLLREVNRQISTADKKFEGLKRVVNETAEHYGLESIHPKMKECLDKMQSASSKISDYKQLSSAYTTIMVVLPVIGWAILYFQTRKIKQMEHLLYTIQAEANRLKNFIENPALMDL